jgi:hypothetical protein
MQMIEKRNASVSPGKTALVSPVPVDIGQQGATDDADERGTIRQSRCVVRVLKGHRCLAWVSNPAKTRPEISLFLLLD